MLNGNVACPRESAKHSRLLGMEGPGEPYPVTAWEPMCRQQCAANEGHTEVCRPQCGLG